MENEIKNSTESAMASQIADLNSTISDTNEIFVSDRDLGDEDDHRSAA